MTCSFPTCTSEATKDKYCFLHNAKYGVKQPKKPGIAKMSVKRKEDAKVYRKIVKEMLAENKRCELNVKGVCITVATGLHHKQGRGKNYLNKELLLRACNPCHTFITENSNWAIENGLSLKRNDSPLIASYDKKNKVTVIQ